MTFDELVSTLRLRAEMGAQSYSIVTADEAAQWPTGALESLLNTGFLEPTQPAETVTCDACGEDHGEPVLAIEEPPGSLVRYYIGCPVVGTVHVDPERMRRWRVVRTAEENTEPHAARDDGGSLDGLWPPTAAAFVRILRQAHAAGIPALRWGQIKPGLNEQGHFPHRARDVRRNVPNWDALVDSPRSGFYRVKR